MGDCLETTSATAMGFDIDAACSQVNNVKSGDLEFC